MYMGNGLKKILQLYGAMSVTANGNTERFVWDYSQNKSRLRKEMTDEEWKASEKVRWGKIKNELNEKEVTDKF